MAFYGADIREASDGAVFTMTRTMAAMIEDQGTLNLVLVTGETLSATDCKAICDALVQEAVYRHHRAMARRLFNAYHSRMVGYGNMIATFEGMYGQD